MGPKWQQIREMIGMIIPAYAIAIIIYLLNPAYKDLGPIVFQTPQGTLIALLAKGVITGNIPLNLVLIGAVIGLITASYFTYSAIGLYLPPFH